MGRPPTKPLRGSATRRGRGRPCPSGRTRASWPAARRSWSRPPQECLALRSGPATPVPIRSSSESYPGSSSAPGRGARPRSVRAAGRHSDRRLRTSLDRERVRVLGLRGRAGGLLPDLHRPPQAARAIQGGGRMPGGSIVAAWPDPAVDMPLSGGSGLGGHSSSTARPRERQPSLRSPMRRGGHGGSPCRGWPCGAAISPAVILDLTTVGIHSCDRLVLLAGGRVSPKHFSPV